MTDLASLVVRLIADTSRYRRGLDDAARDLDRFNNKNKITFGKIAGTIAGAALAAGTAFAALAKSAIDAADSMNDLSKSTGISTEVLSQLQYAAEQSGADLDALTTGFRKFNAQIADAASKTGPAREAFELIGVSVRDASGAIKPVEQLLLDVAEQFSKYRDGAAKAAFAQDLFGKSGAALVPFLNEGRAGIERLMKEADRLGLTLKSKTAQAADDFNDKLNTLNAQLRGVVLQTVSKMLPAMIQLLDVFSRFIEESQAARKAVELLALAFKSVLYVVISVSNLIEDIGRALGALFAARDAALKGNIGQAVTILVQANADAVESERKTSELLDRIWNDRAESYNKALDKYKAAPGPSSRNRRNRINQGIPERGPEFPTPKTVVDELQEVEIKLKKIEIPEDFYADLQDQTQTGLEKVFKDFSKRRAALEVLRIDNVIDFETYKARLKEMQNELLTTLSEGPKKIKEDVKELSEFQLQAARNTQDIIASTFEDLATGADVSAQSILKSFGRMIIQLAAQAAAANIAGKLFGEAAGGAKGTTGLIGALVGAFGGTRDAGGRGRPGSAYLIGTGAQPELFVPDRPGTFVPAGAAGMMVTNNFSIRGDVPVSRRTEIQVAAAASLGVQRANRRNN